MLIHRGVFIFTFFTYTGNLFSCCHSFSRLPGTSILPAPLYPLNHCLQPCASREFPLGISALSQMASVLLGEIEQHSGCMEGLWSQLPGSELPLPTVQHWVVHSTSLYLSLFICKIDVMGLMFGSSLNSCMEVRTFSMALFGEGAPKEVNHVK